MSRFDYIYKTSVLRFDNSKPYTVAYDGFALFDLRLEVTECIIHHVTFPIKHTALIELRDII